ncbi:probable crossover junction endonuclease EME2 isoform X4 [Meles meles]|uniref:probable crossover junction endonuclease EME2 isoform X4 n=1 Tax=Meles meles TaxID=9662 RepID=UPI001E69AE8E|nr:probable crossover junction endonuclease EME2 isoform X4 [Meles meles]
MLAPGGGPGRGAAAASDMGGLGLGRRGPRRREGPRAGGGGARGGGGGAQGGGRGAAAGAGPAARGGARGPRCGRRRRHPRGRPPRRNGPFWKMLVPTSCWRPWAPWAVSTTSNPSARPGASGGPERSRTLVPALQSLHVPTGAFGGVGCGGTGSSAPGAGGVSTGPPAADADLWPILLRALGLSRELHRSPPGCHRAGRLPVVSTAQQPGHAAARESSSGPRPSGTQLAQGGRGPGPPAALGPSGRAAGGLLAGADSAHLRLHQGPCSAPAQAVPGLLCLFLLRGWALASRRARGEGRHRAAGGLVAPDRAAPPGQPCCGRCHCHRLPLPPPSATGLHALQHGAGAPGPPGRPPREDGWCWPAPQGGA